MNVRHVLSTSREPLAIVRLPAAFMPFVISDERVLGLHRDTLGVERAAVYTVRLSSG